MDEEVWKVIPGLESYAINNNGIIKALPKIREGTLNCLNNHHNTNNKSKRHYKERIIKQNFKQRYWYVALMHNGIKKSYRVHRLVYIAFIGNIPDNMVIDHIDGNTSNNNIKNLRCVTSKENANNPNTIYKKFKTVIRYNLDNSNPVKYPSIKEAMLSLEQSYKTILCSHIGEVCNGKRKTAYGYKWKWE